MYLQIMIMDENEEFLKHLELYQDGSDSEAADTIEAELIRMFPEAEISTVEDFNAMYMRVRTEDLK